MMQAIYRGKKGRQALGVTKGVAKSESEEKADAFKKKFANLMSNPGKQLSVPKGPPPGAAAGPGVQPNAPSAAAGAIVPAGDAGAPTAAAAGDAATAQQQAEATAEVRNVFR